jgi:hypothetical protein
MAEPYADAVTADELEPPLGAASEASGKVCVFGLVGALLPAVDLTGELGR